jgi:DNA-directed RNA polymerase specialized sigma24 family protein
MTVQVNDPLPGSPVDAVDAELCAAFVARDQRAILAHLMRLYGQRILAYAGLMTNYATVAEELRVQIFVEAYGELAQVSDCGALRLLLWAVARRTALEACRIGAALRRRERRASRARAANRREVRRRGRA